MQYMDWNIYPTFPHTSEEIHLRGRQFQKETEKPCIPQPVWKDRLKRRRKNPESFTQWIRKTRSYAVLFRLNFPKPGLVR